MILPFTVEDSTPSDPGPIKTCRGCLRSLPWSGFYLQKASGRPRSRCIECETADQHARRAAKRAAKPAVPPIDPDAPKVCIKCGELKSSENYLVRNPRTGTRERTCKACKVAISALWFAANRGRRNQGAKRWRDEHPETVRESAKKYHRNHIESVAERKRRYRASDHGKAIEAAYTEATREYYRAKAIRERRERRAARRAAAPPRKSDDPDWARRRFRAWVKANPAKAAAIRARCRHRRRARERAVVNDLTAEQWAQIQADQDHRCYYCGTAFGLLIRPTRDHIIPVSKGGGLTAENIVAACGSCNSRKGTKILPGLPKHRRARRKRFSLG